MPASPVMTSRPPSTGPATGQRFPCLSHLVGPTDEAARRGRVRHPISEAHPGAGAPAPGPADGSAGDVVGDRPGALGVSRGPSAPSSRAAGRSLAADRAWTVSPAPGCRDALGVVRAGPRTTAPPPAAGRGSVPPPWCRCPCGRPPRRRTSRRPVPRSSRCGCAVGRGRASSRSADPTVNRMSASTSASPASTSGKAWAANGIRPATLPRLA